MAISLMISLPARRDAGGAPRTKTPVARCRLTSRVRFDAIWLRYRSGYRHAGYLHYRRVERCRLIMLLRESRARWLNDLALAYRAASAASSRLQRAAGVLSLTHNARPRPTVGSARLGEVL